MELPLLTTALATDMDENNLSSENLGDSSISPTTTDVVVKVSDPMPLLAMLIDEQILTNDRIISPLVISDAEQVDTNPLNQAMDDSPTNYMTDEDFNNVKEILHTEQQQQQQQFYTSFGEDPLETTGTDEDHDLDALAEIVPGLFSAMHMSTTRTHGDTSEQGDEELWRIGAVVQDQEAYTTTTGDSKAYGHASKPNNTEKPPPQRDDDSIRKSTNLELTKKDEIKVEDDDALSSTSSTTITTSDHAKPPKSTRGALAKDATSFESDEVIDDDEEARKDKKSDPKSKSSPPSSVRDGSESSSSDCKPASTKQQQQLQQQQQQQQQQQVTPKKEKSSSPVAVDNDPTPPRAPQPQALLPMYLPCFKPATGCTNASDFIVRCFVARLRCGISVLKHGRSRWCKSVTRILHIHPDGCSLSWKPPLGEPTSSKKPPKLDLSECKEVRHAWSPDPLHPLYTGTVILRHKCEAANAHKSFALIFPKRTVDVTAITADQCKVLMEGFSALCFRLQVAGLAGQIPGFTEAMENVYERSIGEKSGEAGMAASKSSGGLS